MLCKQEVPKKKTWLLKSKNRFLHLHLIDDSQFFSLVAIKEPFLNIFGKNSQSKFLVAHVIRTTNRKLSKSHTCQVRCSICRDPCSPSQLSVIQHASS